MIPVYRQSALRSSPILVTERWAQSCDPGVEVTLSHPPGGRLPLLSARHDVTSIAFQRMAPTVYTVAHV